MPLELMTSHPYLLILSTAFIINIPLGYIRENYPKFSFKWLFWIHASIPLIVYLRVTLETSKWLIPLSIAFAIWGQILGSQTRRGRMSQTEREALAQVPEIISPPKKPIAQNTVAVALLNMGGPRTNKDVKDFQKHLFADPLLIRFPLSFLLQKLFAWLLITFRLKATQERYQLIGGGSPIYESTAAQAQALKNELHRRGVDVPVIYSFNYSPPFPQDTIAEINKLGRTHFLPISLYTHYSKATTGSNMHYLRRAAREINPELKCLKASSYHLHEGLIDAFVDRIHEALEPNEKLDDFYLLFSAHGLPLYFLTEGDPYPFLVSQTVAKLLGKLKRQQRWSICYQSAVGPLQWLKPSTEDMLEALAKRKEAKIFVVPISFVGDHIETLCEIDIEYRELANQLGIKDFRMSKAIEDHPRFITALADTVEYSLGKSRTPKKEVIHG